MVENFLRYLEYEKRYSKHTIAAYEEDLQQLTAFLQTKYEMNDPSEANHTLLRGWIVDLMENGLKPISVNRKIAAIKSYYKFLLRRKSIPQNPAGRLKPLKTEKLLPGFVKETEMDRLLDNLEFPEGFVGSRDRLILELFYVSGMRLSELISLRCDDVNYHTKTIKVLGKRNKERIIPLPDIAVSLLNDYLKLRDIEMTGKMISNRVFLTESGGDMYPVAIYRIVKTNLSRVTTLKKRSPHILRHSYATHLLNRGAELNAVKELLGHANLSATQVYTHNTIEKLKRAFEQAHPKA